MCIGSSVSCVHNGTSYADGETWTSDTCDSCTCRDGLSFCHAVDCPKLTSCGWVGHVDGLCCPVCKGISTCCCCPVKREQIVKHHGGNYCGVCGI